MVNEMLDEVVLAIHGRHQIFLFVEYPVGVGESPDSAGVKLLLTVGVLVSGKPLGDLPIEAAAGILHTGPELENVPLEDFPDLLQQNISSSCHGAVF